MHRLIIFTLLVLIAGCSKNTLNQKNQQVAKTNPIIDKQVYLSENIAQGQILVMEDDSIWVIKPSDQIICAGWIGDGIIHITNSNDANFPYILFNPNTDTSVLAKMGTLQDLQN